MEHYNYNGLRNVFVTYYSFKVLHKDLKKKHIFKSMQFMHKIHFTHYLIINLPTLT